MCYASVHSKEKDISHAYRDKHTHTKHNINFIHLSLVSLVWLWTQPPCKLFFYINCHVGVCISKHKSLKINRIFQIFRTFDLYKEFNSRCRTKTNVIGKYEEISYNEYLKLYPYQKHLSTYTVFKFRYLKNGQTKWFHKNVPKKMWHSERALQIHPPPEYSSFT